MPSIVQKLIKSTRAIQGGNLIFCTTPQLEPIANFNNYYESKLKIDGYESENLRKLKEFHDARTPYVTRPLNPGYKYPHDFEFVNVTVRVTKSGKIRLVTTMPFVEQYNLYQAPGQRVPVNEKVRLMKLARYPDNILKKIVRQDYINTRDAEKNKLFLEKIFGKK